MKLPLNEKGRDFFVGDIHGHYDHLMRLLDYIRFDPEQDRLISVGDLVDRGMDTLNVLRLYKDNDWFHATMGNHEEMAGETLRSIAAMPSKDERAVRLASKYHLQDGGEWTLLLDPEDCPALIDLIDAMPCWIEVPVRTFGGVIQVGVVHGQHPIWLGPWPPREIDSEEKDGYGKRHSWEDIQASLLWGRTRANAARLHREGRPIPAFDPEDHRMMKGALDYIAGIDLIISGHTRFHDPFEPLRVGNQLWLDTAIDWPTGALTMVDLAAGASGMYFQICKQGHRDPAMARFRKGEIQELHPPGER